MQPLLLGYLLPLLLLLACICPLAYTWYTRTRSKLREWEEAYRNIELQLDDRTQKLRNINNMLYGEIAQHERTEEKLRKTQEYLGSIINSMPSVLVSVTATGRITHWNTSAERATDIRSADVAGKLLWEAYPNLPVTREIIQQAINTRTPQLMEGTRLESRGQTYFTDITVYPLIADSLREAVILVDDVTVRIMMENRMIQNEKMLSLGELAAGMAHEINNPLGAILQNVQNIERRLSPELPINFATANTLDLDLQQMKRYLEEREIFSFLRTIRDAGERSARIVSNMLGFSRSGNQHIPTDLNALVNDGLELSESLLDIARDGGKIRIFLEKQLAEDMPLVPCSAPEILQVLLNILRNASQALSSVEEPMPRIITTTGFNESFAWIRIADNGPGIKPEAMKHIFEPFFTTKEVGQGTGLGMSISYFIITEHHAGSIDVESTPGHGAAFTIRLPIQPQ